MTEDHQTKVSESPTVESFDLNESLNTRVLYEVYPWVRDVAMHIMVGKSEDELANGVLCNLPQSLKTSIIKKLVIPALIEDGYMRRSDDNSGKFVVLKPFFNSSNLPYSVFAQNTSKVCSAITATIRDNESPERTLLADCKINKKNLPFLFQAISSLRNTVLNIVDESHSSDEGETGDMYITIAAKIFSENDYENE